MCQCRDKGYQSIIKKLQLDFNHVTLHNGLLTTEKQTADEKIIALEKTLAEKKVAHDLRCFNLESDKKAAENRIAELETALAAKEKSEEQYNIDIKALKNAAMKFSSEMKNQEDEIRASKAATQQVADCLHEQDIKNLALVDENKTLEAENQRLNAKITETAEAGEASKATIEDLRSELKKSMAASDALANDKASATVDLEVLITRYNAVIDDNERLSTNYKELAKKADEYKTEAEQKLRAFEEERAEIKDGGAELQAKIAKLTELVKEEEESCMAALTASLLFDSFHDLNLTSTAC